MHLQKATQRTGSFYGGRLQCHLESFGILVRFALAVIDGERIPRAVPTSKRLSSLRVISVSFSLDDCICRIFFSFFSPCNISTVMTYLTVKQLAYVAQHNISLEKKKN